MGPYARILADADDIESLDAAIRLIAARSATMKRSKTYATRHKAETEMDRLAAHLASLRDAAIHGVRHEKGTTFDEGCWRCRQARKERETGNCAFNQRHHDGCDCVLCEIDKREGARIADRAWGESPDLRALPFHKAIESIAPALADGNPDPVRLRNLTDGARSTLYALTRDAERAHAIPKEATP